MKPSPGRFLLVCVLLAVLVSCANAVSGAQPKRFLQMDSGNQEPETVEAVPLQGTITVVDGDSRPGNPAPSAQRYFVREASGVETEVMIGHEVLSAVGGARKLNGSKVEVLLEQTESLGAGTEPPFVAAVRSLRILRGSTSRDFAKAVIGSQPWVSILCKFSDVSDEPRSRSYFQSMYASTYPGLDHYWRELSYDNANIAGSTAVVWVNLPHPVSTYESSEGGDLNALVSDCTAAANHLVYFPDFVGINMMFNDTFGPYAWGGSRYLNLDGQSRMYRVTWEPPWGYKNVSVIAHEMGHGFGLPHSNNADGDSSPYDNPWDVMSDSWGYALHDSTYGTVGKGTISYHLNILGWIPPAQKLDISSSGIYTAMVDNLEIESTSNLRLMTVQIPDSNMYYTVEVRDLAGYDGNLPGFAVLIHEVSTTRREDAWLVDPVDPGNGADEGAMWLSGECFDDQENEIEICVESVTTEGFVVRVLYGDTDSLFSDGFESGSDSSWDGSSQ